jgi:hypothetical protein
MNTPVQNRHERMVEAAVWLAEQGFADIGWARCGDGKAPNRHWKADATDDPAMIVKMLRPGRNALVIPKGKAAIVDADAPAAAVTLEAAGMPPGFRVSSPTPGHGHFYVWQNGAELPTNFAGGEVRRGGSGMVLGPWALRTDGVYTPNTSRVIPELPAAVADTIVRLRREKQVRENKAQSPADPGWQIIEGRHDYLKGQAVRMRGDGLTDERLRDEVLRLRNDRCAAPGGRAIEDDEVQRIVDWVMGKVGDRPPPITITGLTPANPPVATIGTRTAADLLHGLPPDQLVNPFLTPEGATVIYARGGTGKGMIACYLARELVRVNHMVMVIDFEGHEREWGSRLRGLGGTDDELSRVHYRAPFASDWTAPTGSLATVADAIRDDAARLGVTILIVDSYSVATSNGDTMGGEAAAREYFSGLARIGLPSLTIAHVRGDSVKFPDRPFGSVFVHNLSRETWAIERVGDDEPESDPDLIRHGPHIVALELRNKKSNARPASPAQFVTFSFFDDGSIEVLTDAPSGRSVADLAADALSGGALTLAKIAAAIEEDTGQEVGENALRSALTRHPQRFAQDRSGKRPYPWSVR